MLSLNDIVNFNTLLPFQQLQLKMVNLINELTGFINSIEEDIFYQINIELFSILGLQSRIGVDEIFLAGISADPDSVNFLFDRELTSSFSPKLRIKKMINDQIGSVYTINDQSKQFCYVLDGELVPISDICLKVYQVPDTTDEQKLQRYTFTQNYSVGCIIP